MIQFFCILWNKPQKFLCLHHKANHCVAICALYKGHCQGQWFPPTWHGTEWRTLLWPSELCLFWVVRLRPSDLVIWSKYGLEGLNCRQHPRGHVQINGKCTCPFSWEAPIQRPCNPDDLGKLGNSLLWFSGLWPRLAKSLLANYLRGTRLFLQKKGQLFQYCDKWYCIYVLNLSSRKEFPLAFLMGIMH